MGIICNPIIPGMAPDPSILRVGDDYYLATSTFTGCRASPSTTQGISRTGNS